MMGGVHPAYDFSLAALRAGKNVVTSNKAVVADFGPELLEEAASRGLRYLYEASVGGGIPIIRPLTEQSAENDINEIVGILNGTTNYILTAMKKDNVSFDEALATAQKLGYAEADPTADVDGFDSCRKICILAAVAFGVLVPYEKVKTVGIRAITAEEVKAAEENDCAIKLVGRAAKTENGLFLSVEPIAVRRSHPLYAIEDVFNGILVNGTVSGDLLFYGMGAGKLPTAGAVVTDILDIASRKDKQPKQMLWKRDASVYSPVLTDGEQARFDKTLGLTVFS
jgi:homoserine dehydrogenase